MLQHPISISASIITLNEEANIGRCLDALSGIVEEVVVVDSGSTDSTRAICQEKGARVVERPFAGFARQKNFAVSLTSHPWVLCLDADEVVSAELKQSILEVKNDPEHLAFSFNRLTNYCGRWIRHSGWYPDRKVRLWHKESGRWGGTNPHEHVELDTGVKVRNLKGDLLHYSYTDISDHISRINTYTDMAARYKFEQGETSSLGKALARGTFKFFRNYLIKLGFLDGYYGLVICLHAGYETFIKYIKLRELRQGSGNSAGPE